MSDTEEEVRPVPPQTIGRPVRESVPGKSRRQSKIVDHITLVTQDPAAIGAEDWIEVVWDTATAS